MFCSNCGQELEGSTAFCSNCGSKTSEAGTQPVLSQAQPAQSICQAKQYTPQQPVKPVKIKKRSGCLTFLLIFIGVICVIALSAYFLVPGLFRPFDLGVKTSAQAYESAMQRLNFTKDKAPTEGSAENYRYSYGNPQTVDTVMNSEEITSFFNVNRPPYYALKNVQLRINPDNTIEAAATLDVSYIFNSILNEKYSKEDAEKALPMLGILPNKINFYCKFSGGIRDNEVNQISIHKVSVMGITIPDSLVSSSDTETFIRGTVGDYLNKTAVKSNARFDLIEVENGELIFKGQIPSSVSRTLVR